MRLSDEIVLGSSLITLNPATWLQDNCGCLIGMAAKSRGTTEFVPSYIRSVYPWLEKEFPVPPDLRTRFCESQRTAQACSIISVYAWAVYMGDCTFENAIGWIRANEPESEERVAEQVAEQLAEPVREESCNSVLSVSGAAK